ncbi:IS3 family transposase [Streptomyces sp. NPDC055692]|uniref:IS3 family transposase n=3 Tax=unclassified Streptomyces TaxID=2593676 RepID=UPI00341273F9
MHVVGIDGHKKSHTLVSVNQFGRRAGTITVAATPAGHAQAIKWITQFGQVLLAIEDCRHLTRRFEADLLLAGHAVVRVHTRLMAGARRSARERGKSDPIDAEAVARVALREPDLPRASLAGPAWDVKLFVDHRRRLVRSRTAAANKLRWFLHELDPELPVPSRGLRRLCVRHADCGARRPWGRRRRDRTRPGHGVPSADRVADFTHVATFAGVVYVAFVVDTFSRRIAGWSAATSKETRLVLDALEMALWQRERDQRPYQVGELILRSDAGSQYTSFALAEHLDRAGIAASIGSVGDAYDNALMESTIGLFKTELIKPRRPWKTLSEVELATAEWVDWYCHRRLHGEIGHIPPAEYETNYYRATTKPQVTVTT